MKYIYFMLFTFVSGLASAQILYSEDFENGFPSDIVLANLDGLTPDDPDLVNMADSAWTVKFISSQSFGNGLGSNGAFSVSWYQGDEGPSNDWMILPAVDLGGDPYLSWTGMAITSSGDFRDQYQVFVATGGQTIDDFITAAPVFDKGSTGEDIVETAHAISLSDYANETVYIAFRNFTQPYDSGQPTGPGNGGNELVIDNIVVSEGLSIASLSEELEFNVYPNPSQDGMFQLSWDTNINNAHLEVLDLTGKIVHQERLNLMMPNLATLDLSALTNGNYQLVVRSNRGVSNQSIVIQ